ncbi:MULTISPECIES: DUF1616 domain-containing protein [Haloferax]|uniref:DUF1616 domain-containing protein n=1 Tax=Haloferax marinum TaxID=2666143 RepID=A0A6A8G9C8_9EURY|nr:MULTISPECIES: DUF1616 domain-containing protein [Haloferax]KAB1198504.1 DUF1616 domain-containing protein [Haloferax sp. CBA1150]MRW97611.1 DUF1616 domain-containing protein [Haloferax marinum]
MSTLGNVVRYIERIEFTIPSDLVGTVLLLAVADVLLFYGPAELPLLKVLFGLPMVLFVPGYLVVALLFPRRYTPDGSDHSSRPAQSYYRGLAFGKSQITWKTRAILSVGMSFVVVPLLGVVVALLTGSVVEQSILMAMNVFVIGAVVVGTIQRLYIPAEKRLTVPLREWAQSTSEFFSGGSRVDSILSVVFVVSVVVAVGVMGFALLSPDNGETYTNVALLTEDENGSLVASGYPTDFTTGEGSEMVLRVENYEDAETTYSVVVELQRVSIADNSSTVTEETQLLRTQETVSAGETWEYPHTISPTMEGENLRLAYHVYKGEVPDDPNMENSYRNLHLWISVSDSGESASMTSEVDQ